MTCAAVAVFLKASMKLNSAADLKTFPRTLDEINKLNKFVRVSENDNAFLSFCLKRH